MTENASNRSEASDATRIEGVRTRLTSIEDALGDLVRDGVDAIMLRDGPLLVGHAKASITQSGARYRHLINQMNGLVAELLPSGEILYLNEAMQSLLGCSVDELCGFDFFEQLLTTQIPESSLTLKAHFLETDELKAFRTGFRTPDGSRRFLSWSSAHVLDSGGRVERLIFLGFDVTQQVLADQELRIAAIAFESQEGMAVTDSQARILRVNKAFSEITGYSAEEAVGQNPRILQSGRHDATFYAAMWQELTRDGVWAGEMWNRRKNGEVYPEWLTITAVKGEAGQITNYVGTFVDSTLRKAAAHEIERLAFFDPLTELANRRLMLDRLKRALTNSARRNRSGALMLIDLDNFKSLNDTLGHNIGDKLLVEVGQRLAACVREGDTVARLGGDEFVVILEDLGETGQAVMQAEAVATKIQDRLRQAYSLELSSLANVSNKCSHHCTSSIGITLFRDGVLSPDELIKQADLAMYQAKAAGRNSLRFFYPEMQAAVSLRAVMEAELRSAIREEQFVVHYQMQVNADGKTVGAEALVRWNHPQRGLVLPGEFIDLAEETALILPLGRLVVKAACEQLASWASQPELTHLTLAVNVSALQFHHEDFVTQVAAILEETGANPERLQLELTESLLIKNLEGVIAKMMSLKRKGVSFSLDDFGTGYSSLAHLKRLPIDQLKIDLSFVRDVLTDPSDAAIARTVLALGQSLGLEVIAEGVETRAQQDFLASLGCTLYQGYLFSLPLPLKEFQDLVRQL